LTLAAIIERLYELPPDGIRDLLVDSEAAGSRVVRRLVADWADGSNRFDRPGEALYGARVGGRLVGVCGLNIDPFAGDDRVGRVRHLYVLTPSRRLGIGRQLVMQVVESARHRFDTLHLRTHNADAARLYRAIGFLASVGAESTHVLDLTRRSG